MGSTLVPPLTSAGLRAPSTPCRLRSMTCSTRPRALRRRPRRPWSMLLALLMSSMKGGKAAMAKLESRIRELEIELGNVQARTSDNLKGHQKAERKIKELQFQNDEDKKNQVAMSDLAGKLQAKIKTYKKQIEEAEEIAALNLAKFRKAQQELEETEDRARLAESALHH